MSVCLSTLGNPTSRWTGDFWSKSISLILAYHYKFLVFAVSMIFCIFYLFRVFLVFATIPTLYIWHVQSEEFSRCKVCGCDSWRWWEWTGDMWQWQLTGDSWQVTVDRWNFLISFSSFLFVSVCFDIGATIRTHWEIHYFPYTQFFLHSFQNQTDQTLKHRTQIQTDRN